MSTYAGAADHEPVGGRGDLRRSCCSVAYFTYGRFLSRFLELDRASADAGRRAARRRRLRADRVEVSAEPAFLGDRRGRADRRADSRRRLFRLAAGADLDSRRLDLHRRRARHDGAGRLDPPQGPLDRRSRPRPHEPAVVPLFLVFIWIALVYIIVAFTDITAVGVRRRAGRAATRQAAAVTCGGRLRRRSAKAGGVTGGAIATSSLLYLVLPIIMGLLLRYTQLSLGWATVIFVPLVGVVIWIGQYMPLDIGLIVQHFRPGLSLAEADHDRAEDLGRAAARLLPGRRRGAGVAAAAAARAPGRLLSVRRRWRSARSACCSAASPFKYDAFSGWDAVGKAAKRSFRFCSSRSPAARAPAFTR